MLPFPIAPPLRGLLEVTPHGHFGEPRPTRNGIHQGVDFRAAEATPVISSTMGQVARTGFDKSVPDGGGGGGNYVIVRTGDYEFGYFHLSRVDAKKGQALQAGDAIGLSGHSGTIDGGPHLHYQIRQANKGAYINPEAVGLPIAAAGVASSGSSGSSGGGVARALFGIGLAFLLHRWLS